MGLRFRKSKKIGPFRVNISKSGVGYSYGNKYARVTHTADGKKRTTLTAPGTGLSYVHTEGKQGNRQSQEYQGPAREKKRSGCLPWALFAAVVLIFAGLGNGKTDKIDIKSDPKISTVETVSEPTKRIQFRPVSAEAEKTESTTQPVTKATVETTAPTTETTTQPTTAPVEEKFIVNTNTKKFHHTWCGYAPDSNTKSFWLTTTTRESLEQRGYMPCKKCF